MVIPRKSLSQNFLIDEEAAGRIVDCLHLSGEETVLEIGAGKGALTGLLVDRAKKVMAVEIDRRLCSYLQRKFGSRGNLEIIHADILQVNLESLIGPGETLKVVGNLPYKITSPVLEILLKQKSLISSCVLMVQKEVAMRICADPGSRNWSPLSIAIQLHSDTEILFHLTPDSFSPAPRVDSSVIRITFLSQPRVTFADRKLFFKVVRSAFQNRRKMVLNSLAANLDLPKRELELILNQVGVDPRRRPETLSIEEYANLSSALCKSL